MKRFFKKILNKLKYIFSFLFYLLPINKNKITFDNFGGKGYGCNPKYLAEEFLKDKKYKLIWFVNDINENLPKEIKKVKYGSLKHYFHLITAKLWIDNIRNSIKPPLKRKSQIYVQTWHGGIDIKKIERDAENYLSKKYLKQAKRDGKLTDFILSGSEYQTEIIKQSFWLKGQILKLGVPKDDIFFNENKINTLNFRKIKNLENKKIILYAPTFRSNKNFYNNLYIDTRKIINAFNKKFNSKHILAIRIHPNDVNKDYLKNLENVIFLNDIQDSNFILACVDYVISDFSSVLFDFARLNKPSFVFAPDYDNYIKAERPLYFDIQNFTFPFAITFEKLIDNINNFNSKEYNQKLKIFHKKFNFYNNKNSSKRIKVFLENIIKTHK